jgi:hypothetical protein
LDPSIERKAGQRNNEKMDKNDEKENMKEE